MWIICGSVVFLRVYLFRVYVFVLLLWFVHLTARLVSITDTPYTGYR